MWKAKKINCQPAKYDKYGYFMKKVKKLFSKTILIQIWQYFAIIIAVVILFYMLFYMIYSSYFNEYIERTRGALTIPIIMRDMLSVVCATIFPVIIPFMIVFGYIKSKRIYIPVISAILCVPFFLFFYQISQFSPDNRLRYFLIHSITIIFGVLLAYFFKLFLWSSKKLESIMHGIIIFLLKAIILLVMCFFIFYVVYFLFFIMGSRSYFFVTYSWDSPPTGPYYIFLLSIILSFFLGSNKKYLIYNTATILLLLLLFLGNIKQFSYDIKELYLQETFDLSHFAYNFFLKWRYCEIILLMITFFVSSFLFIFISDKINFFYSIGRFLFTKSKGNYHAEK